MTRTSVSQHAAHIRRLTAPAFATGSETVSLAEALGRLTAAPIASPVDLPLFRNSQMDGFAVRAADVAATPATLPVVGEIAARPGTPAPLAAGTAVRIMTGAVVPEGADAIVPVEDTTVETIPFGGEAVIISRSRAEGEYVRDRGSDVHVGDTLLPAGTVLAPRHLAVLAAAGISTVLVRSRVRVVIVTTGAELIQPGTAPALGQVFDANAVALDAAVRACGGVVVQFIRNDDDDPDELEAAMVSAAPGANLILTSGGISMGNYEVVREVLEPLGGTVGHIAMQPGGPQATALFEGVPVISFPGNPVSTQISFEVFVAPLLREAAGLPAAPRLARRLAAPVTSIPGKRQFLRGRLSGEDEVEIVSGPGSHLVAGLAAADVLVDIPEAVTELAVGDTVEAWVL